MKIVVGGRFDYIQFAWQKAIDSGLVSYFTNETRRKLSLSNRVRAKIEDILAKFLKKKAPDFAARAALREYFDIDSLKPKDEILFILYEMNFLSTDDLLFYLKRTFPKAKFVLVFTNTIGSVRPDGTAVLMDNRECFDLIYTFNEPDAIKYGFRLYPDLCGDFSEIQAADCDAFDVFFAGRAKGRLEQLLSFASLCVDLGLTIRFYIAEVPAEKQRAVPGVVYGQYLPYLEMLSIEKRAKAILNILQGVSSGLGLRDQEAMGMNKVLITDNELMFLSEYYEEKKMIPLQNFADQVYKLNLTDSCWSRSKRPADYQSFLAQIETDLGIGVDSSIK